MGMKKLGMALAIATFIATFAGCATQRIVWEKEGATQQDFLRAKTECLTKANQAGFYAADLVSLSAKQQFVGECMEGEGFQPRVVGPDSASSYTPTSRLPAYSQEPFKMPTHDQLIGKTPIYH